MNSHWNCFSYIKRIWQHCHRKMNNVSPTIPTLSRLFSIVLTSSGIVGYLPTVDLVQVKFSHSCYWVLVPELIPVFRQSALRWLCHPPHGRLPLLPGLWLPSQLKSVTAHRPVPYSTAWWQRHMRVSSLPRPSGPAEIWTRDQWMLYR